MATPSEYVDCEWMFGDAGEGMFGKKSLAHLNPLRWSGKITLEKGITDLEKTLEEPSSPGGKSTPGSRPILLKVPASSMESRRFDNSTDALNLLKTLVLDRETQSQIGEPFNVEVTRSKSMAMPLQQAPRSGDATPSGARSGDATPPGGRTIRVESRNVDVTHHIDHAVEVEVPEHMFHSVIKQVPQFVEQDVEMVVEVPEVHHHEDLSVKEQWFQEEVETHVPRITVREVLSTKLTPRLAETEEHITVAVQLPRTERIIEKPNVIVQAKVNYTKSRDVTPTRSSERVIEVPYVVQQPRLVTVPRVEHRQGIKEFVVPHVTQVSRVVEVMQEETVEKVVDVDQTHTIRNVRYIPEFIQEPSNMSESIAERALTQQEETQSLQELQVYIAQLEQEKKKLREQLGESVMVLNTKKQLIEEEKRMIASLKEVGDTVKGIEARSMKQPLSNVAHFGYSR